MPTRVEQALRERLTGGGVTGVAQTSTGELIPLAGSSSLLAAATVGVLQELRTLHDLAVEGGPDGVFGTSAMEYVRLAEPMLLALSTDGPSG